MADSEQAQDLPRTPAAGLALGERLRSARKAKALSVQQVAESLRLEEASIVALEEERFDAMGAPVFVRGHLKRYAQLVGLSPDVALDAYRSLVPQSDAPPTLARPKTAEISSVRIGSWIWWLAAAIIFLLLILALSGGGDDEPTSAPPGVLTPAPSNTGAPAPPEPTGPTLPGTTGSAPTGDTSQAPSVSSAIPPSPSTPSSGAPGPATEPAAATAPVVSPAGT